MSSRSAATVSFAARAGGSVRCVGQPYPEPDVYIVSEVEGARDVVQLDDSAPIPCARTRDGARVCWRADRRAPPRALQVPELSRARAIAGQCVAGDDGHVTCWTGEALCIVVS